MDPNKSWTCGATWAKPLNLWIRLKEHNLGTKYPIISWFLWHVQNIVSRVVSIINKIWTVKGLFDPFYGQFKSLFGRFYGQRGRLGLFCGHIICHTWP